MIYLYQGPAAWGGRNMSPFCAKLETWLRMVKLPYEARPFEMSKAPKGKMPFVEIDGQRMGDSALIMRHLIEMHGDPLDGHLTAEQRALGRAVTRMLEEGTYWCSVHGRWSDDVGFAVVRKAVVGSLPGAVGRWLGGVIGALVLPQVRKKVRRSLVAQGTGRHTAAQIAAMGIADVEALCALLGDKPFVLGEAPTSYDATVFAFAQSLTRPPFSSPLLDFARAQQNLMAYERRMAGLYFPEG